jgi:RNA-directed DNA polymerase
MSMSSFASPLHPIHAILARTTAVVCTIVGGVVSPVLANLFLHYAFDLWVTRTHPNCPWCRYADDGLVHCPTEQEAQSVMAGLQARLEQCHLEMHPTKTKIVYCKDGSRKGNYINQDFEFPGYGFRPRLVKNFRRGSLFWSFTPAVSQTALTAMRETIRKTNLRNRTQITLEDVANEINPLLQGWIEYYGRYCPSALYPVFRHVNKTLVAWAMRKYKRLAGHRTRASAFLETISKENPQGSPHFYPAESIACTQTR